MPEQAWSTEADTPKPRQDPSDKLLAYWFQKPQDILSRPCPYSSGTKLFSWHVEALLIGDFNIVV